MFRRKRAHSSPAKELHELVFGDVPVDEWVPRADGAPGEPWSYLHLYTINRGILMTPFHNMALMCPATTDADVDAHTAVFAAAAGELLS